MIKVLHIFTYDKTLNCINFIVYILGHAVRRENVGLLAGISAFKVGIDGFCEGSCHWQSVLGPHGEWTWSSGASLRKHTYTNTKGSSKEKK